MTGGVLMRAKNVDQKNTGGLFSKQKSGKGSFWEFFNGLKTGRIGRTRGR